MLSIVDVICLYVIYNVTSSCMYINVLMIICVIYDFIYIVHNSDLFLTYGCRCSIYTSVYNNHGIYTSYTYTIYTLHHIYTLHIYDSRRSRTRDLEDQVAALRH